MMANIIMMAVMVGYTTTMEKAIEIAEHTRMLHRIYAISGIVLAVSIVVFIGAGIMLAKDHYKSRRNHVNEDGTIDVDFTEVN